jgi:diguanylate cyclase (GGDEF)-like protein/PAS domain S-box-containing protein
MGMGTHSDTGPVGFLNRVRAVLPQGNTLPYEIWLRRHRWLVGLLAAQGVGMTIYALAQGFPLLHSIQEGGILVAFAVAAWAVRDHQRLAGVVCSIGLITTSAVLVHVSGGLIEAHFHFFVMIILLTLYEDWIPFLIAAAYVLVHHGLMGALDPGSVYNHPDAVAHPFKWAAIHAFFVTGAGAAAVVAWRLNEIYRAETASALELARSRERSLTEAQELANLGGWEYEILTTEVRWSPQLYQVFGLDPEAFTPTGERFRELIDERDHESLRNAYLDAVEHGGTFSTRCRYAHPDGTNRILQLRGEVIVDEAGEPVRVAGTFQDVSERELARELALRRADAQRAVAELGERALGTTDLDGLFEEAIASMASVLRVEMAGLSEWIPEDDEFMVLAEVGMDAAGARYPGSKRSLSGYTLLTGKPVVVTDWSTENRFERPAIVDKIGASSAVNVIVKQRGRSFGVLVAASRELRTFDADEISFVQAVANVLSAAIDRVDAEEEMRHQGLHDPLTGLPNRVLFVDRLDQALAQAKRSGGPVGVLFCDVDQFKLVNNSLGHETGDELLRAVAQRFSELLRPGDTLARFAGDEFGVLVGEISSVREVTRIAERVAASLASPFVVADGEHFVTASTGIAIGDGTESAETLLRDADLAMRRAKERGRGRYELVDELMRERAVGQLRTENDLRRALDRDELRVHYQPIVSLATGAIGDFEALARWEHPERGLLSPAEFIPMAEESGLVVELGDRVLELACEQGTRWHLERPQTPVAISVNVSARQLADPEFPDRVASVLERTGLPATSLRLEVTETTLVEEHQWSVDNFTRLKGFGVGVVLDDFGTGFSSLGYLRRFPFDLLKIDRSFIEQISIPTNSAIVTAVIGIAEALELEVVAEGIETKSQLAAVKALGCHHAQGYLFSRPVPAAKAGALLRGVRLPQATPS